jgi:hypothetical protein
MKFEFWTFVDDVRFSICILVTMQIGVLHDPIVTDSKFPGSFGHPLAALDPATFSRAAQIQQKIIKIQQKIIT